MTIEATTRIETLRREARGFAVPPRMTKAAATATRTLRKRPLLAGAAALLIALGGWYVLSSSSGSESTFVVAPVVRSDIENNVTALGNIQPLNYVDVGAQATGQLKTLTVDIGSTVKQGQLLAEIDSQVANAKVEVDQGNLANLQAQLRDKQAQVALANANFQRQKRLLAAGATAASEYDAANQAAQSAVAGVGAIRAQISASQSQLNGDQVTLGYTRIDAPMSGTVVSVALKQGQTINSVQQAPTILRIADLDTMQVQTQVSEADVPKLKVGMPAYFTTLGNPGRKWTGTLAQIQPTPTVTNNVVLYTATFNVANPDHALMTQMTAQVFFVTASAKNAITVPVAALHGKNHTAWTPGTKNATVMVMGDNGKPERRNVTVGVSNRVSAQILSGLEIGQQVVAGRKTTTTSTSSDTSSRPRGGRYGGGMGRL